MGIRWLYNNEITVLEDGFASDELLSLTTLFASLMALF
jgi:hypothetical protein